MKNITTTTTTTTNTNITMEETEMKNTTTTNAETDIDKNARVLAEMTPATLAAWGWSKDPDSGFFEKDDGTMVFTTWAAAAASIAPAAEAAMAGDNADGAEIDRVADVVARATFEWLSTTRVSDPWLQRKPWTTDAEDEAALDAAIAAVIADRPVTFGAGFDPEARVLAEMNSDTIAAWGWSKDAVTGTFDKDEDTATFGSWEAASAEFVPAIEAAMVSDGATPGEIDKAADLAARESFEWISTTRVSEPWLQERPSLAAAGAGSKEARKIIEEAIFDVLEDRI